MANLVQEFEANVLRHVHDDQEGNFFAYVSDFEEGRYFIKTNFHEEFLMRLNDNRATKNKWIYLNGIEGLGKTSSAIYYVLRCRENGDRSVHYIDLDKIEKRDGKLENFDAYSKKFADKDCVIVDHVTVYNTHYLEKIKRIVEQQVEDPKFILIETGFTASAHKSMEFGRKFQLDEDSFLNIWKGSLEKLLSTKNKEDKNYKELLGLIDKGKEVYDEFSKEYIITPRLLNSVLENMYTIPDPTAVDAFAQYTKEKQHKILSIKSCENHEYAQFQLHTGFLLHLIPNRSATIMKGEWAQEMKIGINIFEVERYKIQPDDLQSNLEYARMGLDIGDVCVKINHLIPNLGNTWRERFPYNLEAMLRLAKTIGYDKILPIFFQHGGGRKEFEKMFVESQKMCKCVLLPFSSVKETLYQPSQKRQKVLQTPWKVASTPAENFFQQDGKDLSVYNKDIPRNLKGHERSVALFALYIKQLCKSVDRFLVYPLISTFMGIDYFVFYGDCGEEGEGCSSSKKVKVLDKTLYLVQVATGAVHRGDTIGQALNIVKQIFVNENVKVHAIVVVACRDKESYTLTKCAFENISVLNLDGTEEILLQKNQLLHDFYLELVRFT